MYIYKFEIQTGIFNCKKKLICLLVYVMQICYLQISDKIPINTKKKKTTYWNQNADCNKLASQHFHRPFSYLCKLYATPLFRTKNHHFVPYIYHCVPLFKTYFVPNGSTEYSISYLIDTCQLFRNIYISHYNSKKGRKLHTALTIFFFISNLVLK